ncbi:hypothetical protein D3C80_726260 [compost metagenome]
MDCSNAVDDFADTARKFARSQLAQAPEFQHPSAHPGYDAQLYPYDAGGEHTKPHILNDDETKRCQRLTTK